MNEVLWECHANGCGFMTTQPSGVKEVMHRCSKKSERSIPLKKAE
jgi:hypothetical protein